MKKIFSIFLIAIFVFNMAIFSYAAVYEDNDNERIIERFITIVKCWNSLSLENNGKMVCCGKTEVDNGNIAGVKVELQQLNGNWTTIKTWSNADYDYVRIQKNWYVNSGYSYRLKVTHSAYDSNMNFIESSISYSDVIYY